MKKIFSILFASLILLSGVHLTVASHICCGELAAVKWSITGAKASCGMEEPSAPCPSGGVIDTNCCKNHISRCSSDSNYFPSIQKVESVQVAKAPLFNSNCTLSMLAPLPSRISQSMVGPPLPTEWQSVDQSFLCVFII